MAKLAYKQLLQNVNLYSAFPKAIYLIIFVEVNATHRRLERKSLGLDIVTEDVVADTLDLYCQPFILLLHGDLTRVVLSCKHLETNFEPGQNFVNSFLEDARISHGSFLNTLASGKSPLTLSRLFLSYSQMLIVIENVGL